MAMDPVSTVLLALQSQPEVRLSWEKRLPFWLKMDPQAQPPGVLRMGSTLSVLSRHGHSWPLPQPAEHLIPQHTLAALLFDKFTLS